MNRIAAITVGALLLALIGGLVWKSGHTPIDTASPAASAGQEIAAVPAHAGDGGTRAAAAATEELEPTSLFAQFRAGHSDAGASEALDRESESEESASALPKGSPKTVRFGVILVQYRGAQGAQVTARSKDAALVLARTMADEARTDFKAQVARGDSGSMNDAGRIPRGVLEPPVEFALFTLTRGAVSDPIDTPRGYWIVKRIE